MGFALLLVMIGGTLFALVGVLGLVGKLPRNHIAGIRTSYTLSSDEAWEKTHRAAAPFLIFGGVAVAMAGLAFAPFAFAGSIATGVAVAVILVCAALLVGAAFAALFVGTNSARGPAG
jgi:uncharacterized membrane protein